MTTSGTYGFPGLRAKSPHSGMTTADQVQALSAASPDKVRQPSGETVEDQTHAPGDLQILVHGEPDFQCVLDRVRQDGDEFRRSPRDVFLAAADADAGAQRRELGEVAVAAEAEIFAMQPLGEVSGAAEAKNCRGRSRSRNGFSGRRASAARRSAAR